MDKALEFLTIDDQALLIEFSRRATFAPGTTVLQQGDDAARAIYTIWSGIARVEVNGVSISHLGPGSLFGEMSFVDGLPASASVVAHTELGVDLIDAGHLHTLLASVPGFAARFYKSLAALVCERLRTVSILAAGLGAPFQEAGASIRLPNGDADGECPAPTARRIDCLCAELRDLATQARDGGIVGSKLEARVASACDRLLDLLVSEIANHPEDATAIGRYLFRETFPYLMTSQVNEHAYSKPRGYGGDGELLKRIRADRQSGYGALGAAVDRWVLDRPIMGALRARGAWIMQSLQEFTATWEGRMPVPVSCLMTGTSDDLFELKDFGCALDVTCMEMDPETLQDVAKRIASVGGDVRISFVQTNLLTLQHSRSQTFLHSQKVIIVPDLLNRYDDETAAIHLLDWMHERLREDGAVILGQLRPNHPDRAYLEHILRWHYRYRDQADLERLFAESKFRSDALNFEHHADGVQTKVICRRYQ